ncbi:Sulfate permease, MFS superfamily [Tistlia consotensis]|uniref:Sulfate permease, MFS superfamily n=1 Tax=Tistlia consotensis USBA 355 TaxID=560819 RepID=A0A1Y6CDA6_9PROT|nr:putative sulfate/molybdate transporter [Tistlia consotensis]SMF55653.1 Sulfate permease, MFS superfamily [Tistlia consotensis USBA 355]SNR88925.1 Sulfate permease, MFS superfamily [Tistlia consotensis]
MIGSVGKRWGRPTLAGDLGGAFGDLGTLLPFAAGAIALGLCRPAGLLVSVGLAYLLVAGVYRLPVAVQPMKAVGAIVLTTATDPETLAACGLVLAAVIAAIGLSRIVERAARLVPRSLIHGLQAGLGLTLSVAAIRLILSDPWIGLACAGLAALALLWNVALAPVAVLLGGAGFAWLAGGTSQPAASLAAGGLPLLPDLAHFLKAVPQLALAQLPLTLTNAILLTEILARRYFPDGGQRVTIRRLSLTTGLMNLVAAPLGGLPLCHGAGGLAAHVRFGARSWLAPAAIGLLLLAAGLFAAEPAARALLALPPAAVGVLLLVAGVELLPVAAFREARPSCRPVILATALATVAFNPLIGLVAGTVAEALRWGVLRLLLRSREDLRG